MTPRDSLATTDRSMLAERLGWWVALAVAAPILLWLAFDAGRPITTDDLWWHLELGRVLLESGFPDGTPPLLLRSGYPRDSDVVRSVEERSAGFLAKPFTTQKLLSEVAEILEE